jgi:tetratricopeptide (TPR) repeat protein
MKREILFLIITCIITFNSCSINRFATRIVADALGSGSGGSVFTSDDDPEFIASALPFALKTFESLLESDPENINLLENISSGYISYANAFLQSPAEMYDYNKIEEKDHLLLRAASMYRRGGDYADRALEILYPGFNSILISENWSPAFDNLESEAVPFLYWKAAAFLGEFSVDSFNPELMVKVPFAFALIARSLELDEDYNHGSLHDLMISVIGNIPVSLLYLADDSERTFSVLKALKLYYSSKEKTFNTMSMDDLVIFHLNRSIELSNDTKASPYVSTSVIYVKSQDYISFVSVLNKAININIDKNPSNRLINIISKRKAAWLLEHAEDYFYDL